MSADKMSPPAQMREDEGTLSLFRVKQSSILSLGLGRNQD